MEMLRRRIADVPARSVGPSRLSLAALASEPPDTEPPPTAPSRVADEPDARPAATLRTLPVPGPLAELIPHGGLVRGSTVQVSGVASLQAGLVAAVTGSGGWAALVGRPSLGLLAAVEMGAQLRRCALIPDAPDPVAVAAILVDGLDLVVMSLGGIDVPLSRARAVAARARRNGTVLVVTEGRWPTVDLHLDARVASYAGLDEPARRITGISLDVEATARGRQTRRARIDVRGSQGAVSWTTADHAATPAALKVAR
ncbi:hypothetical protein GS504_01940 [Rhodococcus hoagii]|nr:hypothetical protein [Prescottella equi]NKS56374.1 hypothetical protein [Prescottella equi]NKS72215.1 hypothetical protein [Prescottella equi]